MRSRRRLGGSHECACRSVRKAPIPAAPTASSDGCAAAKPHGRGFSQAVPPLKIAGFLPWALGLRHYMRHCRFGCHNIQFTTKALLPSASSLGLSQRARARSSSSTPLTPAPAPAHLIHRCLPGAATAPPGARRLLARSGRTTDARRFRSRCRTTCGCRRL